MTKPRRSLVRRGSFTPRPDPDDVDHDEPGSGLPLKHALELAQRPLRAREWVVEPIVPKGETTLVYGPGAAGKSLLLLQLCIAVAAGRLWLMKRVPQGRVLFYTCEDDVDEINRRAARVLKAYGATWSDCGDRFAVVAMRESEQTAVLATTARDGTLTPTPTYHAFKDTMAAFNPDVTVVDTLADVFAGNENDRGQAKQFIKLIESLGRCTYIVTAHPSVSGQFDGRGSSGSTGWPAAVRSHLYMERAKDDDGRESDPDARELTNKKANYARAGDGAIEMRWTDGVFERVDKSSGAADRDKLAEDIFVELLGRFTEQGRYVNASSGATYAPAAFSKEARAKAAGVGKRQLVAAMGRLFDAKRIEVTTRRVSGHDRAFLALATKEE